MKDKIKIALFIAILTVPTIIYLAISLFAPDLRAKLDFDLGEKREKATIEAGINDYYSDRVPFRSSVISYYQSVSEVIEKPYNDVLMPAAMKLLYKGRNEDTHVEVSNQAFNDLFGGNKLPETPQTSAGEEKEPVTEPSVTEQIKHNYELVSEVLNDCEHDGYRVYKCSDCEEEYTEVLTMTGHDWQAVNTVETSYLNYGYTEYVCQTCKLDIKSDFVDKLVDDSYLAPKVLGDGWTLVGRFNWLFLYGNGNIAYYKANNLLSEEKLETYAEKVNTLKALCDERGITLAISYAPNKDQVYSEYMPTVKEATDYKRTARLVDYLKENTEVAVSYPLQELKAADRYWQVYYKYDTHWNSMGGFIGIQAIYSSLGLEVTNPLDLKVKEVTYETDGDLFALGGIDSSSYPKDKTYEIEYRPEVEILSRTKGDYSTIKIYKSTTSNENGKKLVLLGDSYRTLMIPLIEKDFEKNVIAHRDYVNSVAKDIKTADVLVIAAVERYDTRVFTTIDKIIEILSE